jgi:hypothetical protein
MSDTFYLSLAGIIAGIISAMLVYINRSKCVNFSLCFGLLKCVRNIDSEIQIEEFKINHKVPESPVNKV